MAGNVEMLSGRREKNYAAESGAETLVAQAAALDGQAVAEQAVA